MVVLYIFMEEEMNPDEYVDEPTAIADVPVEEVPIEESVQTPVESPTENNDVGPVQTVVEAPVESPTENITVEIVEESEQTPAEEPVQIQDEEPVESPTENIVVEEPVQTVVEPVQTVVEPVQTDETSVPTENITVEIVEESEQTPAEESVQIQNEEPVQSPTENITVEIVEESEQTPTEEPVQSPTENITVGHTEELVDEPVQTVVEPVQTVVEPAVELSPDIFVRKPPVDTTIIPKIVFIVPYRNREEHHRFFDAHMKRIMEDYNPMFYKIFYIHQNDKRSFNRGAMKNIGFLHVKSLYPDDYQKITLVFNDIDSMLSKKSINYETVPGIVKHFYGYKFTLGGIVSITAGDFEKIDGFPNYWAWGYEDNMLQTRALSAGLTIDRTTFYPFNHPDIIRLNHGTIRQINRSEFDKYANEARTNQSTDGIKILSDVQYSVDGSFVQVGYFSIPWEENVAKQKQYDTRNGSYPYKNVRIVHPRFKLF
jgi:hypothetical protein